MCAHHIEFRARNTLHLSVHSRILTRAQAMSIFLSEANQEQHLAAVKLATEHGVTLQGESDRVRTLTSAYPNCASPPRLGSPRSHPTEALNHAGRFTTVNESLNVNQEMEMAEQEGSACASAPGKGRGRQRKAPRWYTQVEKKHRAPKGRPRGPSRKQAGTDADHRPKSCFSDLKVGGSDIAFMGSLSAFFRAPSSQELLNGRDIQSSVSATWEHDQDYEITTIDHVFQWSSP